ncbi:hypothetical protein T4A_2923 [Trichinella pseudospiralis]|uniref:Uncharacterized protein n=1 Tax=Trichinella pseudospiralis TaxID=6337 RepID=A0A0V1EP45_TRIPS|nr:hypothetical protein T4A_2923 [Trichinella pseudospiralis]
MVNASVGLLANGNRKKLMLNNRFCVLSVVHRIFKAATTSQPCFGSGNLRISKKSTVGTGGKKVGAIVCVAIGDLERDILKMSELYNENHLESMNNIHQNTIHSITSKAHLGIHNNVHSHP